LHGEEPIFLDAFRSEIPQEIDLGLNGISSGGVVFPELE
jgi:hypothetical protein